MPTTQYLAWTVHPCQVSMETALLLPPEAGSCGRCPELHRARGAGWEMMAAQKTHLTGGGRQALWNKDRTQRCLAMFEGVGVRKRKQVLQETESGLVGGGVTEWVKESSLNPTGVQV